MRSQFFVNTCIMLIASRQAMASVWFATATCGLLCFHMYAMSATTDPTKDGKLEYLFCRIAFVRLVLCDQSKLWPYVSMIALHSWLVQYVNAYMWCWLSCVICGGPGISDAYYCRECCQQEKDRDGCPKIVNLGSSKTDLFYERKKYGFKKRWYGDTSGMRTSAHSSN